MLLLCLCRRCCGGRLCCGLWAEAEGAGGQGEQRGGRNFLQEQRIISPPIHFLPLSTLPAPSLYLLVESLDEAPNQPSFANIFFWSGRFISPHLSYLLNFPSHHISYTPTYLTTSPEAEVVVRWLYLYWWSSHQQQNATNWVASLSRYRKRTTGKWQ